jgi:hypothetical protein
MKKVVNGKECGQDPIRRGGRVKSYHRSARGRRTSQQLMDTIVLAAKQIKKWDDPSILYDYMGGRFVAFT